MKSKQKSNGAGSPKLVKVHFLMIFAFLFSPCITYSQKQVAFTIDDVPNAGLYNNENFQARLLHQIDSMKLPVGIFINEQRIFSTDSIARNLALFTEWIKSPNVTLGNHGFKHVMYSTVGLDSFKIDVIKGSYLTKELGMHAHKQLNYYRFPYNDLGMDAGQHKASLDFLKSQHYIMTPFTVHSEDWMVTELYQYYKQHNKSADAERIGHAFVKKTLDYFRYIETLTERQTGREVKQIYLMHDNLLNADYLPELITELKKLGYSFISLDDAMQDPIYRSVDYFQEKPGISWVYRWMKDKSVREQMIMEGPNVTEFEKELKEIGR